MTDNDIEALRKEFVSKKDLLELLLALGSVIKDMEGKSKSLDVFTNLEKYILLIEQLK